MDCGWRPCYFREPMADKKGFGSTVLGWFVVREGEEQPKQDQSAEDLIAKYANDAPPPPAPPEVKLTGELPKPKDGQVDFAAVFRAAGLSDDEQGRIDKAMSLLKTLPAETPKEVKKQIVEASLKAFGVPIDEIIECGAQEIQALEVYIQSGQRDTQGLLAESQKRTCRARGRDRAHQKGDGRAGRGAICAAAIVQSAEAEGARGAGVLRAGSGGAGCFTVTEAARTEISAQKGAAYGRRCRILPSTVEPLEGVRELVDLAISKRSIRRSRTRTRSTP